MVDGSAHEQYTIGLLAPVRFDLNGVPPRLPPLKSREPERRLLDSSAIVGVAAEPVLATIDGRATIHVVLPVCVLTASHP